MEQSTGRVGMCSSLARWMRGAFLLLPSTQRNFKTRLWGTYEIGSLLLTSPSGAHYPHEGNRSDRAAVGLGWVCGVRNRGRQHRLLYRLRVVIGKAIVGVRPRGVGKTRHCSNRV